MAVDDKTLRDPRLCVCGQKTKIIETRLLEGPLVRRRECRFCGSVHVTYEITQVDYWERVRLRNNRALLIAAEYLKRESDRLLGVSDA